ncbi:hypothetical protein L596_001543 [Steinernema carpocapsae]|uniref:Uncharacterized protein n=1 Tax=Steinernema carpocapsae TaxID=34508 RepID=A0A4U8ULS4_STECR|nr:hypothetical protein L596_001543 [Steinernema carpocapsae]
MSFGLEAAFKDRIRIANWTEQANAQTYRELISEGAVIPWKTLRTSSGGFSRTGPLPTAPRRRSNGQKACAIKHKFIEFLKHALKKAWDEITSKIVACILKNFQKRLDVCINAQDAHFEVLDCFLYRISCNFEQCN